MDELTDSITLPGSVNRINVRRDFSIQGFRHIVEGDPGFYVRRQIRAAILAPISQGKALPGSGLSVYPALSWLRYRWPGSPKAK